MLKKSHFQAPSCFQKKIFPALTLIFLTRKLRLIVILAWLLQNEFSGNDKKLLELRRKGLN